MKHEADGFCLEENSVKFPCLCASGKQISFSFYSLPLYLKSNSTTVVSHFMT